MTRLVTIRSDAGIPFQVSTDARGPMLGLLNDLEQAGYAIDPRTSGGYNYRTIAGTNTLSNHAFGNAIDVNWNANARGSRGDIPPDLARSLAAKHGLTWGGDWRNPDPMHFELAGARGGSAPAQHSHAQENPPQANPGAANAMPDRPSQPPGLLDDITGRFMNPLTMAGLSILADPSRDVGRGMQLAGQMQDRAAMMDERRRQIAQQQQRERAFGMAVQGMGGELGQMGPLIGAMGAEQGGPLLLQMMRERQAASKPTDDMREYLTAKSQGFQGTFMDYMTKLREAGSNRVSIDQRQETEFDKALGKQLAEEYVTANRAGASAQRDIANLGVMRQALDDPNLYTGTGGQQVQSLKKAAQTLLGVEVKGVSSGEVMSNLASEIAVSNKQKLPGPMSDADRQFLVDMAPNLSKSPDGNRLIIDLTMAHKQWEKAKADAVRQYAQRNGGRLDPGVYEATAGIDAQFGEMFAGIMTRLRGMGGMAPRSPMVGVPDPLGLRR